MDHIVISLLSTFRKLLNQFFVKRVLLIALFSRYT